MLVVDLPATSADEDNTVIAMANLSPGERQAWLAAYKAYRRGRGNPFKVAKAGYHPAKAKERRNLYKSRGSTGTFKRLRLGKSLICCAMCGSHHNGTLDHYLPKEDWPEFSILLSNLVPCCALCNSGAKGTTVSGNAPFERFLHPYYDRAARGPLWKLELGQPYAAPRFAPRPVAALPRRLRQRVAFHLREILSDQFHSYVETQWSRLPQVLGITTGENPSLAAVEAELAAEYRRSVASAGLNGWRTVLLRGICADRGAIGYLHSRI